MLFSIEANIDVLDYYRLQKSGEWRLLDSASPLLMDSDLTVKAISDVERICRANQKISIGEKNYRGNPSGAISIGDRTITWVQPRVHRFTLPHVPKKEDLVQKIASTPMHSGIYAPIITIYGDLDLKKRNARYDPRNDFTVAARTESLSGDYLGRGASTYSSFINETFRSLLGCWLLHLETGLRDRYGDMPEERSEEELLSRIHAQTRNYSKESN